MGGGIRLAPTDVDIVGKDKFRVRPPMKKDGGSHGKLLFFHLQLLKRALPNVCIAGLPSIHRAVVNKDDKVSPTRYEILVEGYGFREVMAIPGLVPARVTSNHVMEVEKELGIEAARRMIMKEITAIMAGYGISVDARHIQMLGDCMTYRGMVLGINRYGISRMRTSTLMLASFERTTDLIFDAAAHQQVDPVTGVSECIILGSSIKLGTGLFKVLYDYGGKKSEPVTSSASVPSRKPLLSAWKK